MVRSMRARAAAAAASLVIVAAAGCGSSHDDPSRAAQQLADQVYPGELSVFDSWTFGHDAGSKVVFRVADDPDAAVQFKIPAEGSPDAGKLREAVAEGRWQAAELRALRSGFDSCGLPIVAVTDISVASHDSMRATVWARTPVNEDTVGQLSETLDRCVRSWLQSRDGSADLAGLSVRRLSVNIADPETVPELPEPPTDVPTITALSDRSLTNALRTPPYHSAFVSFVDGQPSGITLRPVRTGEEEHVLNQQVRTSADEWLDAQGVPHTMGDVLTALNRLLPGSVRELRSYVAVCDPLPEGKRCIDPASTGVVAATIDLETGAVRDHRLIADARAGGFWRVPLEPAERTEQ
jgi:hypothetical protein